MRFTITSDGIKDLQLSGELSGRVFDGPSIREGLLAGFDNRTRRIAKKLAKVEKIEAMDVIEQRLMYYVLTVQDDDHQILGPNLAPRWDHFKLTHFELTKHAVESLDVDGDCGECSLPVDSSLHIPQEVEDLNEAWAASGEVPPTPAPGGEGTSATD